MRIAIVDDSKNEQQIIGKAIYEWSKTQHQTVNMFAFNSGEAFAEIIDKKHYDIVFMDIYMKDMTGIDTAIKLRQYHADTLLIFFTTSAEHMAQAFPCHAFDYLMKPIDISRLYKTLDEALKLLPDNQPYIEFTFEKQNISLLYSDIICILSDSNYCIIRTKDNEYRVRASFNDFTSKFKDAKEFFSIGRGIMVNLDNVVKIENLCCTMINNDVLPVSRRKKDEAEQALLNRRFEKRRKGGIR